MKVEFEHQGSSPLAVVQLGPDESVLSVSSAFVAMSAAVDVKTRVRSGQFRGFLPGSADTEAFFLNSYRAQSQSGQVLLAPRLPGEIFVHTLGSAPLIVKPGAFLAADESVKISTVWRGGRSVQSDEGLKFLRCAGSGCLLLNCFGAVHSKTLDDEEAFVVDIGHIVALDDNIRIRLRRLGGLKSVSRTGEELVAQLQGPGRVDMQTRNVDEMRRWLDPA